MGRSGLADVECGEMCKMCRRRVIWQKSSSPINVKAVMQWFMHFNILQDIVYLGTYSSR